MWYLYENIYLVDGKCNAAIYDLNNGFLYQINSEAKQLMERILSEESEINEDEKNFIRQLEANGIITQEYVDKHCIEKLKEKVGIDFAWIEITDTCNLKCIHCYDQAVYKKGKIMTYTDFCHIIVANSHTKYHCWQFVNTNIAKTNERLYFLIILYSFISFSVIRSIQNFI